MKSTVTYAEHVGRAVRKRRKSLGMSVKELAAAAGVDASAMYSWERGRRRLDINRLPSIAIALQITVSDIFRDAG